MLSPVVSLLVYFTEMLISYIFFSSTAEKRYAAGQCLLMGAALFLAASGANLVFHNNAVINAAVTILVNSLFAVLCFENKWILGIFYAFISLAISAAWEFAAITAVTAFTQGHFYGYNSDLTSLVLEVMISKALYFLTVLFLCRIATPGAARKALPLKLLLHPAAITVCLVIFWDVCTYAGISPDGQKLLAAASMILLVSTVLLFVSYQHQVEQDRASIRMKSEYERLQTEKAYYDILEQQNQQLMLYAHDAKHHLAAISSLNRDPQIAAYVSKLSAQLADYARNCHTGNKMLDVMIHKFSVDCAMRGLEFEYDVTLCNLSRIDDLDLVAILGNLIDNAVAAAEKSGEKKVSLATAYRNSYNVIIVTNSCDVPPKTNGTRLITSKENRELHGFGLKSVQKTLKKYQGDLAWEYSGEDRTFTVTAMAR